MEFRTTCTGGFRPCACDYDNCTCCHTPNDSLEGKGPPADRVQCQLTRIEQDSYTVCGYIAISYLAITYCITVFLYLLPRAWHSVNNLCTTRRHFLRAKCMGLML